MQTLVNDIDIVTESNSNIADVNDVAIYFEGHTQTPLTVDAESSSNEPPKRKRGRPAGSTSTKQSEPFANTNVLPTNSIITGSLFITMVDLLLPMIMAFLHNKTSKKKIEASDLQLTEKQKKDLEPICNEVVKKISFGSDPVTMLIISLIGIYGFNLMALRKIK
jgi:hypothetical protein